MTHTAEAPALIELPLVEASVHKFPEEIKQGIEIVLLVVMVLGCPGKE